MKKERLVQIAVVGSSDPGLESLSLAFELGKVIGSSGAVLICGGLGGVMEAAARGAKEKGGLTIGILPDYSQSSANPFIDVVVPTGLGHARNILVAASGDLVVALPGSHGTRSEISIALKLNRPVVGIKAWGEITGVKQLDSLEQFRRQLALFLGGT